MSKQRKFRVSVFAPGTTNLGPRWNWVQIQRHLDKRRAVSEAYPFNERAMHPYKIWLDESRKWLDRRFPERDGAKERLQAARGKGRQPVVDMLSGNLFEGES